MMEETTIIMLVMAQIGMHYTNMKNKTLTMVIVFLILISLSFASFASASISNLGTFKQGDCVNLIQTCDCTYSNITSVKDPSFQRALGQVVMTTVNNIEYDYNFCNNTNIGTYTVNGITDDTSSPGPWVYTYEITAGGEVTSSMMYVYILAAAIAAILLIFAFLFKNDIMGFFSGLAFSVVGAYGIISPFNQSFRMISVILAGLGCILIIYSAYDFLNEMEFGGDENAEDEEF